MVTRKDCCLNIMDLNDDCLELILKRLNLYEQFHVAKVHARFKNVITRIWRIKAVNVLITPEFFLSMKTHPTLLESTPVAVPQKKFVRADRKSLMRKKPSKDPIIYDIYNQFQEFILALSPFMRSLIMYNMPVDQIRKLCDFKLPLVVVFEWLADSSKEFEQLLDEDIVMIKRIFPNLKKLKLRNCQISGKYLSEISSLQKLSLDECHYLESEYFRDVFQTLQLLKFDIMDDCDELNCCDLAELQKCPTLQHIKIADYHLCLEPYILNNILEMPNLKKLSIYSRNFVFDVLERVSRNQIKSIEAFKYNGVLVHTERFFNEVGHMRNLKKLYFFECCTFEDYERIHDHCCASVSKKLTELREIHFIGCIIQSEEGLLQFVANCHHLDLINISDAANIGNTFIWRCLDLLKKQKYRRKPLKIWLNKTNIDKCIAEDPRILCSAHLIKVVFQKTLFNTNPPGVLKFIFNL